VARARTAASCSARPTRLRARRRPAVRARERSAEPPTWAPWAVVPTQEVPARAHRLRPRIRPGAQGQRVRPWAPTDRLTGVRPGVAPAVRAPAAPAAWAPAAPWVTRAVAAARLAPARRAPAAPAATRVGRWTRAAPAVMWGPASRWELRPLAPGVDRQVPRGLPPAETRCSRERESVRPRASPPATATPMGRPEVRAQATPTGRQGPATRTQAAAPMSPSAPAARARAEPGGRMRPRAPMAQGELREVVSRLTPRVGRRRRSEPANPRGRVRPARPARSVERARATRVELEAQATEAGSRVPAGRRIRVAWGSLEVPVPRGEARWVAVGRIHREGRMARVGSRDPGSPGDPRPEPAGAPPHAAAARPAAQAAARPEGAGVHRSPARAVVRDRGRRRPPRSLYRSSG